MTIQLSFIEFVLMKDVKIFCFRIFVRRTPIAVRMVLIITVSKELKRMIFSVVNYRIFDGGWDLQP